MTIIARHTDKSKCFLKISEKLTALDRFVQYLVERPVERKSVKLIVKVFIPDEVAHHDHLLSADSIFILTLGAVLVLLVQLLHCFLFRQNVRCEIRSRQIPFLLSESGVCSGCIKIVSAFHTPFRSQHFSILLTAISAKPRIFCPVHLVASKRSCSCNLIPQAQILSL